MSENLFLADDFFRKLNTEEAYHIEKEHIEKFWNTLAQQVSTQVITQFGIGRLLDLAQLGDTDSYINGGSVSTLHNAAADVFISKNHEARYKAAYDRQNYEGRKINDAQDTRLSVKRKRDFQQKETIIDGYTGEILPKTGQAHVDHVVAAKRIHDNPSARLFMTDDQRNDMAMNEDNLTYTNSSLNQSKGEKEMIVWRKMTQKKQEKNNEERFSVKPELADKVEAKAEGFVKTTINNAQLEELKQASLKQGMTQMKRQLMGLILHHLAEMFFVEMKILIKRWDIFENVEDRIVYFKERMQVIKHNLLDSLHTLKDEFLGTSISAFTSGIIATLITTLINSFVTTSHRLGRIIQEGITNIIKGFKLLITNPEKLEKKELIETVIKLIGLGISLSIGLILTDLVDKELSAVLPKIIANSIATVIGAMFTGTMSALIIHLVDNFDQVIRDLNCHWQNINTQLTISPTQIIETYHQAIDKLDDDYQELLRDIAMKYQTLNKLSDLAFDIESLANRQFNQSIDYANIMTVNPKKILKTESDIDSFFLT